MSGDNTGRPNGSVSWRVFDLLIKLLAVILVPICGWLVSENVSMRERITFLEGSSYRSSQAVDDFAIIRERLNLCALRSEVPGTWLVEQVNQLELRLRSIETSR